MFARWCGEQPVPHVTEQVPLVSVHGRSCFLNPEGFLHPSHTSVAFQVNHFGVFLVNNAVVSVGGVRDLRSIVVYYFTCSRVNRLVVMISTLLLYSSGFVLNSFLLSQI